MWLNGFPQHFTLLRNDIEMGLAESESLRMQCFTCCQDTAGTTPMWTASDILTDWISNCLAQTEDGSALATWTCAPPSFSAVQWGGGAGHQTKQLPFYLSRPSCVWLRWKFRPPENYRLCSGGVVQPAMSEKDLQAQRNTSPKADKQAQVISSYPSYIYRWLFSLSIVWTRCFGLHWCSCI